MNVIVNGAETDCPDGLSLADFVERLGLKADRIAVELNRNIAQRKNWNETFLRGGDRLEIVHFVGGGTECRDPGFPSRIGLPSAIHLPLPAYGNARRRRTTPITRWSNG
jgi:thiamine biosynthesis protein ThiS